MLSYIFNTLIPNRVKLLLVHAWAVGGELHRFLPVLPSGTRARYLLAVLANLKSVVKWRRLHLAERDAHRFIDRITLEYREDSVVIPVQEMDQILEAHGINDHASLELVRELFLFDEYLWNFSRDFRADTVLDIGSNRGFFLLCAAKSLKARRIVRVEPQALLSEVWPLLFQANGLAPDLVSEYVGFCSSDDAATPVPRFSIPTIMREQGLRQIDFLKMDIEGGEFDVFSKNVDWLDHCDNISMEIHRFCGDVTFIPPLLESRGFDVAVFDVNRRPALLDAAWLDHGPCHFVIAKRRLAGAGHMSPPGAC